MIHIAICDDSDIERAILNEFVANYCTKHNISCQCAQYERGDTLYYDINDGAWFDLIFLDIYMERWLGIDAARRLRAISYTGLIVFCTTALDFAPESFEVDASGYMLKPYDMEHFSRLMDRVVQKIEDGTYCIKTRAQVLRVPYGEILYAESRNSQCIIHLTQGREYTVYKKLGDIQAELNDARFLRCHQSYLVNMEHIREAGEQFVLDSGDTVLIRKKEHKEICRQYLDFLSALIK